MCIAPYLILRFAIGKDVMKQVYFDVHKVYLNNMRKMTLFHKKKYITAHRHKSKIGLALINY